MDVDADHANRRDPEGANVRAVDVRRVRRHAAAGVVGSHLALGPVGLGCGAGPHVPVSTCLLGSSSVFGLAPHRPRLAA
jgi:hypothetical protein